MSKKTVMLPLLLLLIGGRTYAQNSDFQLGANAGITIATLVGDDTEGSDSRTSPFIGIAAVWQPAGAFGFETGLNYVSKGASAEFEGGESELKLGYLEVPLLLRVGLTLANSTIRPVISAGASIGFKTGCKLQAEGGGSSVEVDCDDPAFEGQLDTKSLDFGLSAGLGVDIPVGGRFVVMPSVRYTRGLSDIGDTAENADAKNSAIMIGLSARVRM